MAHVEWHGFLEGVKYFEVCKTRFLQSKQIRGNRNDKWRLLRTQDQTLEFYAPTYEECCLRGSTLEPGMTWKRVLNTRKIQ